MTTWANTAPADQKAALDFVAVLRNLAIHHERLVARCRAVQQQYGINCFNILNALDASTVIPDVIASAGPGDSTPYPGAVALTKEDCMALALAFEREVTGDYTGAPSVGDLTILRARAAGASNLVG